MAIITSALLLRSLSALHIAIGYYLLTSPYTLVNQNLVFILGQSMRLPEASFTSSSSALAHPASSSFASASPATALAGLFIAFLAVVDFTAVGLPEPFYLAFWTTQAPVRLTFFMALTAWIYATKPPEGVAGIVHSAGWGKDLKNSLVFSWAFIETCIMFWVFLRLREERGEAAKKEQERKSREEHMH